jgi:hypothetical protein
MTDVKRNNWSAEELGEESSYEDETEIKRRLARGDETVGNPDERDVAGSVPVEDTPEGREDQASLDTVTEKASRGESPGKAVQQKSTSVRTRKNEPVKRAGKMRTSRKKESS